MGFTLISLWQWICPWKSKQFICNLPPHQYHFTGSVLLSCDESTVCWCWCWCWDGDRARVWFKWWPSEGKGCCRAGVSSWAGGSNESDEGLESRAWSLREGVWKQKQNIVRTGKWLTRSGKGAQLAVFGSSRELQEFSGSPGKQILSFGRKQTFEIRLTDRWDGVRGRAESSSVYVIFVKRSPIKDVSPAASQKFHSCTQSGLPTRRAGRVPELHPHPDKHSLPPLVHVFVSPRAPSENFLNPSDRHSRHLCGRAASTWIIHRARMKGRRGYRSCCCVSCGCVRRGGESYCMWRAVSTAT